MKTRSRTLTLYGVTGLAALAAPATPLMQASRPGVDSSPTEIRAEKGEAEAFRKALDTFLAQHP